MATPTISKLRGTGYQQVRVPRYAQDIMDLQGAIGRGIGPGLTGSIDQLSAQAQGRPEAFAALEAPAMRDLQTGLGQISSRFSGMGTGARHSSGFQNATSSAAQEFAEKLAAQRLSLQQNAFQQLRGLYGDLMGNDPYDTFYEEQEKNRRNPWGSAFSGASSGALAGSAFGPWGTGIGALLGGTAGYFGGR